MILQQRSFPCAVSGLAFLGIAILALLATPLAAAAEGKLVGELIAELGAEKFEVRDEARRALIELGLSAIPALTETAEKSDDPEARVRAGKILAAIAAASIRQASLISLKVEDAPLRKAGELISQQLEGGVLIRTTLDEARVTLDLQRATAWEALAEIERQTGAGIPIGTKMSPLVLEREGLLVNLAAPSSAFGPYLSVLTGVTRNSEIKFGRQAQNSDRLDLAIFLLAEPKLTIVERNAVPHITELTDGNGASLLHPKAREVEPRWKVMSGWRPTLYQIEVPQPRGPVKKIGKVRGHIGLRIAGAEEQLEVPDILQAKGKVVSSDYWRFEITEVIWDGHRCEVRLTANLIKAKGGPTSLLQNRFKLLDQNGKEFFLSGYGGSRNDRGWTAHPAWSATIPAHDKAKHDRKPTKLVYSYFSEQEEIEIPFEFRDIPAP